MPALDEIGGIKKNCEVSMPTPDDYKMLAHPSPPSLCKPGSSSVPLVYWGVFFNSNFIFTTSQNVTEG
jgi:hypothetical protein